MPLQSGWQHKFMSKPGSSASTSGREPETYSARAPARTQVGGLREISPLFPGDVNPRLLVPDGGASHLREGPTELETSRKNSWRHWPGQPQITFFLAEAGPVESPARGPFHFFLKKQV